MSLQTFRQANLVQSAALLAVPVGLVLGLLVWRFGWIGLGVALVATAVIAFAAFRDPFNLFLFFVVSWPILTWYIWIPLPASVPDIRYERIFAAVLILIVVVRGMLLRRGFQRITLMDVLVFVYAGAELYGRVMHPYVQDSKLKLMLEYTNSIALPVVGYWLARRLVKTRDRLRPWLVGLLIAIFLVTLTGLYQYRVSHGGVEFLPGGQPWEVEILAGAQTSGELARAAGVLLNAGEFGTMTGMGLLTALALTTQRSSRVAQALTWCTVPVLALGVFLSLTRGAWLAVGVGLLIAVPLIRGLWKRVLPFLLVGLMALAIFWPQVQASTLYQERVTSAGTIETRRELAQLGWQLIVQKPFLGWGLGAMDTLSMSIVGASSHNIYISYLVDGGLLLLISFLAVMGWTALRIIQAYRHLERGSVEHTALGVMAGFAVIYLLKGLSGGFHGAAYLTAVLWMAVAVIENLAGLAARSAVSPAEGDKVAR